MFIFLDTYIFHDHILYAWLPSLCLYHLDQVKNAFVELDREYCLIRPQVMLLLLCYIMGQKDTHLTFSLTICKFSDNKNKKKVKIRTLGGL
jgi:hypothetical protein